MRGPVEGPVRARARARARAIGRVPKWRPNCPNIASPSVTAVWPTGNVPKLRPHCLPLSFSRVAVSLFSMPSVMSLLDSCVPTCFSVSLSFLLHVPNVHSMSLFVCVLITTHTHAHTPDSTSDCHIYYQVMLPGLKVVSMYVSCQL